MRAKTMSKNYYDDEILFVDVESGDIHLKEGVRRMAYPTLTSYNSTQRNYWESAMKKIETFNTNNKNWDNVEG